MAGNSSGIDLSAKFHNKDVEFSIHAAGLTLVGEGKLYQVKTTSGISINVANSEGSFILDAATIRNCVYSYRTFSFYLPGNIFMTISRKRV